MALEIEFKIHSKTWGGQSLRLFEMLSSTCPSLEKATALSHPAPCCDSLGRHPSTSALILRNLTQMRSPDDYEHAPRSRVHPQCV